MNKSFTKLTITLLLIIISLVLLLGLGGSVAAGIWLHTYKVFTKEELVAEIIVGEQMKDENGNEYFEFEYKQVKEKSVLEDIFSKDEEIEQTRFEKAEEYMAYGDQIKVGGEVVKFHNWLIFLGFETIYKISRIEGDYDSVEKARNAPERSVFELNGGTDSYWKGLEKNKGKYNFAVDTVYGSFASKFVQDEERIYGLYITKDGFLLDELDELNYTN
ncbi:hypothetical protein JW796_03450 [Candidatus Dojkabacteria bacterium]|nr:hypothetical protein [Candidatus Dojkabacteria bacterium]